MSAGTLQVLQQQAFNPVAIATAIANKQYEEGELSRYVNGDIETRRRIFNDMVDSPSDYSYLGVNLERYNDLTYDEKKTAVSMFVNSYMYVRAMMNAFDDFIYECNVTWDQSVVNAIFLDSDKVVNEAGETIVESLVRDARENNPTALNFLYMRNALRGEQNGLDILEEKQDQIPRAVKDAVARAVKQFSESAENLRLAEEQTALFSTAVQVDVNELDPELDEEEEEPDFVEKLDGFEADNRGFSHEEECGFGWRRKAPAGSTAPFGNLIVDEITDQKVTTDMMLKTVGKVNTEGSLEEVYKKMAARRDQIMSYVFGKGDASGAFRCVLDKNRLKDNELVFDKKILKSYRDALSNRNIEKLARAALAKREPEDYFTEVYDSFPHGVDPDDAKQQKQLTTALRTMKEVHANRTLGFKIFHFISYIREGRTITNADNVMRDIYHISPDATAPNFNPNAVEDLGEFQLRATIEVVEEKKGPEQNKEQPAVEQMEVHEAAIDTVLVVNNEKPVPAEKQPETEKDIPEVN